MSPEPSRTIAALTATVAVLVTAAVLTGGTAAATVAVAGPPGSADAMPAVSATDTTVDLSDPVDNTTDTVDNTTDTVDNTTDDTTDTVDNITDDATDVVDNTTDNATDVVDNTTDNATDAVDNITDDTTDAVGGEAGDDSTTTTPARETTQAGDGSGTTGVAGDNPDSAAGDNPDGTTPDTARTEGPAGSPWRGGGQGAPTGPAAALAALLGGALLAGERGIAAVTQSGIGTSGLWHTLQTLVSNLRWWALRLLGLVGYSRYDDSDPLDHETRAAAYEFVRGSPGTHLAELADRVDVPVSTLRHHLHVLEAEELVETDREHGRRRFFPAGADRITPPSDAARSVLAALADGGRASVTELADRVDRDTSTVSHHLDRLDEGGFVARERDGQAVTSELTTAGRRALAFPDGDGPRAGRARDAGERSRNAGDHAGTDDSVDSPDSPRDDTSRSVGGDE